MNMRNLKAVRFLVFLLSLCFLGACSKTEFLPDPEGVKIPFQNEATRTLEELLAASPAKLFYSAWQKSNIKTILKEKGAKLSFTVFAPNDAAMQAAGLNAAAISQMPLEELDSLVMFYTTIGSVKKDELMLRSDNLKVKTLLERPGLYLRYYENSNSNQFDLYYFTNYLATAGDNLLINGKDSGKLNYLPATNGGLFVLGKVVVKPTQTMLEALEADGRFTLFIESQRLADELYIDKIASDIEPLFGYKPEPEEIMGSYATTRFYYQKNWGINTPPYQGYEGPNITVSTLFAPTDQAFHEAGFQTVEDILKFNARNGDNVFFDENTYAAVGGYPMDTVYNYHRDFGRMLQPVTAGGDKTSSNATVFYSNMLNPSLDNYFVSAGGNPSIEYAYKMPLAFSVNNNKIQIKVKDSEHPAATVLEGDINTLNGPIHVIDHLLFPKGFKLN
jgi:uncharacterized surface protein with fasciclin (FAS1) repeats